MEKKMPVGVKTITILGYILAVFFIIFGIFLIIQTYVTSKEICNSIPSYCIDPLMEAAYFFIRGISIFLILSGIGGFFICRGLWQGKQWARILTIVYIILFSIITLIIFIINKTAIIIIIIEAYIIGYLSFNKIVKKVFKR